MMYFTNTYLKAKQNYELLQTKLVNQLEKHTNYLEKMKTALSEVSSSLDNIGTHDGLPNQDTLAKSNELLEELETLYSDLFSRNESLAAAAQKAANKASLYGELYRKEKQRETDDYNEFLAQQVREKNKNLMIK